jgi:methylated-DNA-[protein]-cysteine S-methyltransferase
MTGHASFVTFDTAIGVCGVAWTARGICGFQLPESTAAATRSGLERRFATTVEVAMAAAPEQIRDLVSRVRSLLDGQPVDFANVELDLDDVAEFARKVYTLARRIPPGSTRTYGEIATELGDPAAARAVGRALGQNPCPIIVPCHRVLAAQNRAGGFSAHGGVHTKLRLLELERGGVPFVLT